MLHLAVCQSKQCLLMTRAKVVQSKVNMQQFLTSSMAFSSDPDDKLTKNQFFEKYAKKIQDLKHSSPDEFEARLEELKKHKTKHTASPTEPETPSTKLVDKSSFVKNQPSPVKPKCLDDVLKMDLIKDKSCNEIEQIWKQYHIKRSGIFAVIKGAEYLDMMQKAQACTLFVYPLPKAHGYEFILSQWAGDECHFTPLMSYQKHQENAPACMSLIHYPELLEDKGIVLMAGEYDTQVVKPLEATMLAQQVQFYYGLSRHPERFELVRLFNNSPENFNYMGVINQFEKLGLGFAS